MTHGPVPIQYMMTGCSRITNMTVAMGKLAVRNPSNPIKLYVNLWPLV